MASGLKCFVVWGLLVAVYSQQAFDPMDPAWQSSVIPWFLPGGIMLLLTLLAWLGYCCCLACGRFRHGDEINAVIPLGIIAAGFLGIIAASIFGFVGASSMVNGVSNATQSVLTVATQLDSNVTKIQAFFKGTPADSQSGDLDELKSATASVKVEGETIQSTIEEYRTYLLAAVLVAYIFALLISLFIVVAAAVKRSGALVCLCMTITFILLLVWLNVAVYFPANHALDQGCLVVEELVVTPNATNYLSSLIPCLSPADYNKAFNSVTNGMKKNLEDLNQLLMQLPLVPTPSIDTNVPPVDPSSAASLDNALAFVDVQLVKVQNYSAECKATPTCNSAASSQLEQVDADVAHGRSMIAGFRLLGPIMRCDFVSTIWVGAKASLCSQTKSGVTMVWRTSCGLAVSILLVIVGSHIGHRRLRRRDGGESWESGMAELKKMGH